MGKVPVPYNTWNGVISAKIHLADRFSAGIMRKLILKGIHLLLVAGIGGGAINDSKIVGLSIHGMHAQSRVTEE